jgi:hypothetical protein
MRLNPDFWILESVILIKREREKVGLLGERRIAWTASFLNICSGASQSLKMVAKPVLMVVVVWSMGLAGRGDSGTALGIGTCMEQWGGSQDEAWHI